MAQSMTGFGRAQEGKAGRLSCEARSVNHRFLTTKIRLPGPLQRYERDVDGWVRGALSRGSVEISVQLPASDGAVLARLDAPVADHYLEQIRGYVKRRGLADEVSVQTLLGLPGVMAPADPSSVAKTLRPRLEEVVRAALEQLVSMRAREGTRLQKALRREVKALAACVSRIRKRAPGLVRDHRKRLRERVDALLADTGTTLDAATLAREVAIQSDRSDVAEELDRLDSHRAEFDGLLDQDGPIGRSLDFLVQEVGREVNTIGSKVHDLAARRDVLQSKAIVERLREQVQNLE